MYLSYSPRAMTSDVGRGIGVLVADRCQDAIPELVAEKDSPTLLSLVLRYWSRSWKTARRRLTGICGLLAWSC